MSISNGSEMENDFAGSTLGPCKYGTFSQSQQTFPGQLDKTMKYWTDPCNTGHLATLGAKWIKQRYVFAFMGFLAIANAYTMRVCLSVTIVDMVATNKSRESNSLSTINNSVGETHNDIKEDLQPSEDFKISEDFSWNEEIQGIILSSFFWGYIITQVPGGLLAEKIGGKHLIGFGILVTSIFTLLTPIAAHLGGAKCLIVLRILEGLGEGVTYPALNLMLAKWAPVSERSKLGTLVFSGSQIGTVVGMAVSGNVTQNWGWEAVFYLFGGVGIVWYILWITLCYDDPRKHPFISDEEVAQLSEYLEGQGIKSNISPTPWKGILTSMPVWGLVIAHIGHDWGFYTLLTDLPKYMNDILHFDIKINGYLSALPYLLMWIISLLSSCLADWLLEKKILSTTAARKIFTTTASLGPAAGLLATAYSGFNRPAAIAALTLGVGIMGSFYPGMKVNSLDLSPNYAGTLMGITNGIGNICGIVAPYIVGLITTDHSLDEWRMVFFISIAIFVITNIIFVTTASGEMQIWNNYDTESTDKTKDKQCSTKYENRDKENASSYAYGNKILL